MKITIPIEVEIKCRSNCSNCKWGLKPSACTPWEEWAAQHKGLAFELMYKADEYFGVKDKVIVDD